MSHARTYAAGARLGRHVHREAQLLFAASGVMQVATPRGTWLVPPRRAVWLPPRFEHAVDILAEVSMRSLYLDPEWLRACEGGPRLDRAFVVVVTPLLRELILALFDETRRSRDAELLVRLALREMAEAEDAGTFVPMPADPRARRVATMVLADPGGSAGLERLAQEAGLSARTLTRLFPAETELTFKEWRRRARIMAAVEALWRGKASVKQVASSLGFSSSSAFSHAFGQVLGITPTAFIRQSGRS